MVNPISNNGIKSPQNAQAAQSAPASAGLIGLKSNQQATQAVITQLQNNVSIGKANINQLLAQSSNKNAPPLPRGSLVDKLV